MLSSTQIFSDDRKSAKKDWFVSEGHDFQIIETKDVGRAVFSRKDLESGTNILTTSTNESPLVHVILRPYRKEVCGSCFAYNRGREWKIRKASHGVVFCSARCEREWKAGFDIVASQALEAVEDFITTLVRRQNKGDFQSSHPSMVQSLDTVTHVSDAWTRAEAIASTIREARRAESPSKAQKRILRKTLDYDLDADILSYVLYGVIAAYKRYQAQSQHDHTVCDPEILLPSLLALVPDDSVFISTTMTETPLKDYTASYLVLLATLPNDLLPIVSVKLVTNLASRAAHNAFSIRPAGLTDGDQSGEFMGWGVWPEASFFNHSCSPNLDKVRDGRVWSFTIAQDVHVKAGDQLCITYLGGDERDIDVHERRERLREQWGFLCLCSRCVEEAAHIEILDNSNVD